MKRVIFFLIMFYPFLIFSQNNTWGILGNAYEYTQNTSETAIQKVYILQTMSGSALTFTTNASFVNFYKYARSIDEKEPIPTNNISETQSANTKTFTISNLEDSKGYFAEIDGGISSVVWIVDYSIHPPQFNSLQIDESDDKCELLKLVVDKSDDLFFYDNYREYRIIRQYDIEYNTLEWDDSKKQFIDAVETVEKVDIGTDTPPFASPLKDTQFKVSGDQFAKHFGMDFHITSDTYKAIAVEAHTDSEYSDDNNTEEPSLIGISAPVEISFFGIGNEPVAHYYTWKIYKKPDMENPIARYTDRDIKYTFKEDGDYSAVLEVADRTSYCAKTDSVNFSVSDFSWGDIIPNILILNGTHQFRIKGTSILNFKCTIFNRWGNKIYEWRDPAQGWDGRYNGKFVSTGVYYYVMTGESGNGKKHKKSGAINVLKPK